MSFLLLWAAPDAFAIQTVTDPALICTHADRILVAEVTSLEVSRVADSSGDLQTRTWLYVSETLRGDEAKNQTVEVLSRGGALGGWTHWVEDQPVLEVDHRYLLFLTDDGSARVVGGELGAFDLGHGDTRLQDLRRQIGGCL